MASALFFFAAPRIASQGAEEIECTVASLTESGKVRGLGEAEPVTTAKPEESTAALIESFKGMGLSEKAAKLAAEGRS